MALNKFTEMKRILVKINGCFQNNTLAGNLGYVYLGVFFAARPIGLRPVMDCFTRGENGLLIPLEFAKSMTFFSFID